MDPNGLPAGARVLDNTGKLLGNLDEVNSRKGYLAIVKGALFTRGIFVPASLVDYVRDDEIHLTLSHDELMDDKRFELPPSLEETPKQPPALDDTHAAGEPRII
jgi:hypothetical protein